MKTLKLLLLAGAVIAPLAGSAVAADYSAAVPSDAQTNTGFYLRSDIGASFLRWNAFDNDTGLIAAVGAGYQWNDYFRTDLTGQWAGGYNIGAPGTIHTTKILANGYVDFANATSFTPYIGAGLGYGWAYGGGYAGSSGVAVAAHAGVAYNLSSNMALDVGYHFIDTVGDTNQPVEHQVTAGFRFKF
jgi:opacity protein-like surface antigen